MAWLDDRLRDHPKIVKASPVAFRHWALALCYCSAHGTEGRLEEAVKALNVPRKIIDELVELHLWDREPDGLWIHDWQEHNSKRDEAVEERRKADRERQRRHRERVRSRDNDRDTTRDESRDSHRDIHRDGPRGRAPAAPRARTGAPPTPPRDHDQDHTHKEPPAAANAHEPHTDDDAAAANLDHRLEALGLDRRQLHTDDNDLIDAWLNLADTEARTNPAAFVLNGIRTGQPPSPRLNGKPHLEKTRAMDWEARARELFERTGDREQVADWLAGLPSLSTAERERVLVAVAGGYDDEPDLGEGQA